MRYNSPLLGCHFEKCVTFPYILFLKSEYKAILSSVLSLNTACFINVHERLNLASFFTPALKFPDSYK